MIDNVEISVIMGVYNGESTIIESLDSLKNQKFKSFEVIICDDGSSDNSIEVIKNYINENDLDITLIENGCNMGLNYTLNRCLKISNGKYIARMDADDLSIPERFEIQHSFLENNSEVDFVSSAMNFFDENGIYGRTNPIPQPKAHDFMTTTIPFAHAPAMVRKRAYTSVGGYTVDKRLLRVEDYHLWTKMYESGYTGVNIQTPLYSMRNDMNAINRRSFKNRLNESYSMRIAVRKLKLPKLNYLYSVVPIMKGLVPTGIYKILHTRRIKKGNIR